MSKENDGGPAFPSIFTQPGVRAEDGMSLRDWFAGMALQGTLGALGENDYLKAAFVARAAYAYADAMLKARQGECA